MRSASWKAVFCPVLPRFAGQKKLLIICDSVTEKAKYGKMRQVNAVNGSQMVVKIGVGYYRRKQEHKMTSQKLSSLLYTITMDFSR